MGVKHIKDWWVIYVVTFIIILGECAIIWGIRECRNARNELDDLVEMRRQCLIEKPWREDIPVEEWVDEYEQRDR